jgi:lipoprotein-anchoring transpeptidase ErfK/SrfK
MSRNSIKAALIGAALAASAGAASAQSVWDVIDMNRPTFSFFGASPAMRAPAAQPAVPSAVAAAPTSDRPVVVIGAPQTQVAAVAPASTVDTFYDPVTRTFITYDASRLDPDRRGFSPIPREEVDFTTAEAPGTVIIDNAQRRLFLVLGNGRALRYGVGIGRDGFSWVGTKTVTRKAEWPDWRPPTQMLQRRPDLPRFMPGGPSNPLGARALYLGSSLFRIHGSNEPHTIGQAVSSGCFRMTNDDVTDLYQRVRVGARVIVR